MACSAAQVLPITHADLRRLSRRARDIIVYVSDISEEGVGEEGVLPVSTREGVSDSGVEVPGAVGQSMDFWGAKAMRVPDSCAVSCSLDFGEGVRDGLRRRRADVGRRGW